MVFQIQAVRIRRGGLFLASLLYSSLSLAAPLDGEASDYIRSSIAANPSLEALDAAVTAAEARLRGAGRPLHNPSLALEFENGESASGTLGLSQTIDLHHKGTLRLDAAEAALEAARGTRYARREAFASELLYGVVELTGAARLEALAGERVRLLERFTRLHERRAATGDIGQGELILARLALAEARLQQTDAKAADVEARTVLQALSGALPTFTPALPRIPRPPALETSDLDALAARQPTVQEAHLRAVAARALERLAQRERRADPTVGLRAKREEDDTLLGLTLELPLLLRNDYAEEAEAVGAEALQAEREAHQAHREARARLSGAAARLILSLDALERWRREGAPNLLDHRRLLDRLWEGGELTTADYLTRLQQALAVRTSEETTRTSAWRAWVDWLTASGGVGEWLGIRGTEKEER